MNIITEHLIFETSMGAKCDPSRVDVPSVTKVT